MATLCILLIFALAALVVTVIWPFESSARSLPGPHFP